MELLKIPTNSEKEVFTVKSGITYYAAIKGEDCIYLSLKAFDSPLKASNHARSAKRELQNTPNVKKPKKNTQKANTRKITVKRQLLEEAEMTSATRLRFREVWLIVSPEGKYASKILSGKKVVTYVKDKNKAEVYSSYEDASVSLNTLDMVVRRGHSLRRFFERRS